MFNFNDITPEMIARFWAKVNQCGGADACWPYMGGRKVRGYGNFFAKRDTPGRYGKLQTVNAHKFAYVVTYGKLTEGLVVRHTCDNPPCCNPKHLVAGTASDNQQDALGRNRVDTRARAANGVSKLNEYSKTRRALSEQDIAWMIVARARGYSLRSIAKELNTATGGLTNLLYGNSYQDIPLAQRLSSLHLRNIRFSCYPRNKKIESPDLLSLVTDAEHIITEAHAHPTMPRLIRAVEETRLPLGERLAKARAEMQELFS